MRTRGSIAFLFLSLSSSVFSASLHLSPEIQTIDQSATLYVSAADLIDARGLDIEIVFDRDVIKCSAACFHGNALPDFLLFYEAVTGGAGSFEAVLLKQSCGGCDGSADSFLVVTFEPVSAGTTMVYIKQSYLDGDPLIIDGAGNSIEAQVDTAVVAVPNGPPPEISAARLYQNYPNPFNPETTIRFDVPRRSAVRLMVYDVGGRLVRILIDGTEFGYGTWETRWNGTNDAGVLVPSGIYFCMFETCGQRATKKLVILR